MGYNSQFIQDFSYSSLGTPNTEICRVVFFFLNTNMKQQAKISHISCDRSHSNCRCIKNIVWEHLQAAQRNVGGTQTDAVIRLGLCASRVSLGIAQYYVFQHVSKTWNTWYFRQRRLNPYYSFCPTDLDSFIPVSFVKRVCLFLNSLIIALHSRYCWSPSWVILPVQMLSSLELYAVPGCTGFFLFPIIIISLFLLLCLWPSPWCGVGVGLLTADVTVVVLRHRTAISHQGT